MILHVRKLKLPKLITVKTELRLTFEIRMCYFFKNMLWLGKLMVTYLPTVMLIVKRNTLSKLAENKHSAKHSLKKADLEI